MLTNVSFVDPQGQSFAAAVVRVLSATRTYQKLDNSEKNVELNRADITGPLIATEDVNNSLQDTIRVEYAYWPSQASFEAGNMHYQLTNPESTGYGSTRFDISRDTLTQAQYEGLSVEDAAIEYFESVILPTLQG